MVLPLPTTVYDTPGASTTPSPQSMAFVSNVASVVFPVTVCDPPAGTVRAMAFGQLSFGCGCGHGFGVHVVFGPWKVPVQFAAVTTVQLPLFWQQAPGTL